MAQPIIVHTADKSEVDEGITTTIRFTFTITNPNSTEMSGLIFRNVLDNRLTYINLTIRLNGAPVRPLIIGKKVGYDFPPIPAKTMYTLTYNVKYN